MDVAAVREQHTLRPAGRAAGEQDEERVVFVDRDVGKWRLPARALDVGELVLEGHHPQVGGKFVPVEARQPAAVAEQQLRPGELRRVDHLGAGPPSVVRDGDAAERGDGPERERVLEAVGRDDRDAVTLADAVELLQRVGHRRDRREHGCERLGALREHEVLAIAIHRRRVAQQVHERARAVGEHLHGDAEHILLDDLEHAARAAQLLVQLRCHARIGPRQRHALLRVTGVTSIQTYESQQTVLPRGFSILLRSPADIVVLLDSLTRVAGGRLQCTPSNRNRTLRPHVSLTATGAGLRIGTVLQLDCLVV